MDERNGTGGLVRGNYPNCPCCNPIRLQKRCIERIRQKYIRLENEYYADVYSFPMVIALAFRINSYGAEQVRNILLERMYLRKEKINIYFSLNMGEKASPMN